MSQAPGPIEDAVLRQLGFAAHDLATRDKIPVIRGLMAAVSAGLAVDIGSGTGFTTYSLFGERPTVCVDGEAGNLRWYRDRVMAVAGARRPLCVVALATSLPLKSGVARYVLCSEVLEHLDDDAGAASEIARVLAPGGRAVVTVPYTGLGFTSFLERMDIPTVHDFPGPERHVRPGYDEASLGAPARAPRSGGRAHRLLPASLHAPGRRRSEPLPPGLPARRTRPAGMDVGTGRRRSGRRRFPPVHARLPTAPRMVVP